jgi:hypothetical protein
MKRLLIAVSMLSFAPAIALAQSADGNAGSQQAQAQNRGDSDNAPFRGPVAGTKEMTLSGTGTNDRHFHDGSFGITGSFGYYFNKNVEVGLRQTVSWANVGSQDSVNGSSRVALDYQFDLGRWRPFVGANIGAIYGKGVNDTGIVGPEVGLKYFVNNTTFIVAQSEYQYHFDSGGELSDNFDHGSFVHTLGMGVDF